MAQKSATARQSANDGAPASEAAAQRDPTGIVPVYVVEDRERENTKRSFWHRMGTAYRHKDGKGYNIELIPGVSVSGRIVLRESEPSEEATPKAEQ